MRWFAPKPLVDADEFEWLLATVKWIGTEEKWESFTDFPRQVTPTPADFPIGGVRGPKLAEDCFDLIRSHCGMQDWNCELQASPEDRGRLQSIGFVEETSGVLGTFHMPRNLNAPIIRFNPKLLGAPERLISTLAHELSHYRMHSYSSDPPGGHELEELATDVLAIVLGFGIFLANTAKNFEGHTSFDSQGWSSQRSGYLSERAIITVLALAESVAGREPLQTAGPFLKNYLVKDLKTADRHLKTFSNTADLLNAANLEDFE